MLASAMKRAAQDGNLTVPIVGRHVGRAGQCARVVYYVGDVSGLRLSMRSIVGWYLDYALGPVED